MPTVLKAATIMAAFRALTDSELDAVRKALDEEGRKRGRAWAHRSGATFGRRQAGE